MFKKIVIRNVGVLKAFDVGSSPQLAPLSLLYARNGRGKTTLTAVLRAARDGNASAILARRSLGNNAAAPQVTILSDARNLYFEGGNWKHTSAPIEVFDTQFIADNIYAGEMVTLDHDRSLFSLIVGEEGVRLNRLLERFKHHAREASAQLRRADEALSDDKPTDLSLPEFFALVSDSEHRIRLEKAEKSLLAVRDADKVMALTALEKVDIPVLSANLRSVLEATVPDIDKAARDRLEKHFKQFELGRKGELWVEFGLEHLKEGNCPFCARPDADELGMVTVYGQIFGDEYKAHFSTISNAIIELDTSLAEESRTALTDIVARNVNTAKAWTKYGHFSTEMPELTNLAADLRKVYENAKALLANKKASPLEVVENMDSLAEAFEVMTRATSALRDYNAAVERFNEEAKALQRQPSIPEDTALRAVANAKRRIARVEEPGVQRRINKYLAASRRDARAKLARQKTQQRLKEANDGAAGHYHTKVNDYLRRFGVSARISRPKSSMAGNAGSADYSLLIRGEEVARQRGRSDGAIPNFRNTLSSGDKTTLALAFFLAKLDRAGDLSSRIVVFDDPLSSHDSHRRGKTVEAIKELAGRCAQLIVLSHDEYFLREIEKRCASLITSTYQMEYADGGEWSSAKFAKLAELCKSDHSKRVNKLIEFANERTGDPDDIVLHVRQVLETHLRRSYTAYFAHNRNLGQIVWDIDRFDGDHPCRPLRDRLDTLNAATCDNHHGDDADVVPRRGVDPDELKVVVTDALELIGARLPGLSS